MQVVPEAEFRAWLAEGGIRRHSRWGTSDTLVCAADEDLSRFWFPSFVPSDLPRFIHATFDAVSATGPHYLMRRGGGSWYDNDPSSPSPNQIIDDQLRAAGVPAGATGALRFEQHERRPLVIVALAFYVHGWGVGEDLHIFGAPRDCAVMTSHHGELSVHFPSTERLERFRLQLLEAGYDLPTDLPDETFKSPTWLKGRI